MEKIFPEPINLDVEIRNCHPETMDAWMEYIYETMERIYL